MAMVLERQLALQLFPLPPMSTPSAPDGLLPEFQAAAAPVDQRPSAAAPLACWHCGAGEKSWVVWYWNEGESCIYCGATPWPPKAPPAAMIDEAA